MAVAHDGTANVTATFSGSSSVTLASKTTAGANRCGVVGVGGFLGGISSATWGGTAMTRVVGAGGDSAVCYTTTEPGTGAASVVITPNVGDGAAAASSYSGVDQTTESSGNATATATSATPATVTVSGIASGDLVVDGIGLDQNASSPVAGAGQTSLVNANGGSAHGGSSYEASVGSSVTMSWTWSSGTAYWEIVAVALKAAAAAVTAALTGTITASTTEADIVAGGKTIILTLTGDTWVASGATFDAQRQNIINGHDSAQSELLGWDLVVKAFQGVAGVVRTSATVVTITLDAQVTYNITATETITATIPSTAVVGAGAIVATPTFTIVTAGGAGATYPGYIGGGWW